MKNISPILVLFILGACNAATYVLIPPDQYSNYPRIPSLRDAAVNYAITTAVDSGEVDNNPPFSLTSTNAIYTKTETYYGVVYEFFRFHLTLKNAYADRLDVVVAVRRNTNSGSIIFPSFSGTITYNMGQDPSVPFVPVPASEYSSTLITSLANFGKDAIVTAAVNAGRLPPGTYTIRSINSVSQQVLSLVTNYKFDINFANTANTRRVRALFTISYSTTGDGAMTLRSYSATITYVS
jgi:hypothetical protein